MQPISTQSTILNLMLGRERGGLEQAALDYAEALALANLPALTIISPSAWAEAPLVAAGMAHESLPNHGRLDPFAPRKLCRIASRTHARAILCHGNRALTLALRAFQHSAPNTQHPKIIAIAHNYSTRRFSRADACFAITHHLAAHLQAGGAKNISLMPNMVRLPARTPRPEFRTPPVVGSMGRFVAKKGFLTFIEALAILKHRGIPFHAVLGGEGEQAAAIDAAIAQHKLGAQVTRLGWVQHKATFFESLDLFVLPSHHEPFGIALIEAMSHAVPVISADAEGPSEILHHGETGLLVPRQQPEALADAMQALLANPTRAAELGAAGAARVAQEYSKEAMAQRLQVALAPYTTNIIGKSFYASIGEPWDFESDAGKNRLAGSIQQVVFDRHRNLLIFCNVSPFLSSGKKISTVVAVNRYIGSQNLVDVLNMSGSATLNFMFQRSGEMFSTENIDAILSQPERCNFLVGTMKLK